MTELQNEQVSEAAPESVSITATLGTPIDLKQRRVAIGYPSPDQFDHRFHMSLVEMITQTAQFVPLGLTNAVSSRITVNRNAIVENARRIGVTDLLWIDADTKFPINALMRLLMRDKDIVCATTCRRKGNDRSPIAVPMDLSSIQPGQVLVPMRQVGMPFMLTKMSVFDKLDEYLSQQVGSRVLSQKPPYFAEPPRWMTDIPGVDAVVGEDEYFCDLVLKAGFDIWCDMELSMEIGHIGTAVYYIENPAAPEARVDETL